MILIQLIASMTRPKSKLPELLKYPERMPPTPMDHNRKPQEPYIPQEYSVKPGASMDLTLPRSQSYDLRMESKTDSGSSTSTGTSTSTTRALEAARLQLESQRGSLERTSSSSSTSSSKSNDLDLLHDFSQRTMDWYTKAKSELQKGTPEYREMQKRFGTGGGKELSDYLAKLTSEGKLKDSGDFKNYQITERDIENAIHRLTKTVNGQTRLLKFLTPETMVQGFKELGFLTKSQFEMDKHAFEWRSDHQSMFKEYIKPEYIKIENGQIIVVDRYEMSVRDTLNTLKSIQYAEYFQSTTGKQFLLRFENPQIILGPNGKPVTFHTLLEQMIAIEKAN